MDISVDKAWFWNGLIQTFKLRLNFQSIWLFIYETFILNTFPNVYTSYLARNINFSQMKKVFYRIIANDKREQQEGTGGS